MPEYGISLGSNLGDRLAHLQAARRQLLALAGTHQMAASPVYETEAVEVAPEHRHLAFLNAVLIVQSTLPPPEFLQELNAIEASIGRQRGPDRNAPRPIDLDIIYAGQLVLDTAGLILPHPRWMQRRFVVQPLADVRPDLALPNAAHPVKIVLLSLPDRPNVVLFSRIWTE